MGYEDFGEGSKSDRAANHVLVLMAQGRFDHWKQPLAYFFISNTSPAVKLHRDSKQKLKLAPKLT